MSFSWGRFRSLLCLYLRQFVDMFIGAIFGFALCGSVLGVSPDLLLSIPVVAAIVVVCVFWSFVFFLVFVPYRGQV